MLPNRSQRRKTVISVRATDEILSHYAFVRTFTNIVFGAAVGLAMWLLGMANPGGSYLGACVGYLVVGLAGVL